MEEKQHDAGITTRPVPIETPTIAVRLPLFWADRPAVWFAQAEAQFPLAGISSEQTKFCYVISQLDQEQRIRQLLTVEEIGERKPSHFLRYLKRLAPEVSDNVIRSVWISRLPRNVQNFLAGQNESNLEAADLCADSISEVEAWPTLASVDEPTDIGALRQEIAELSRQVAALRTEQDRLHPRFRESDNKPRNRGSRRKCSRPAFNIRRPGRFGARAQNCNPPFRKIDAADFIGGTCLRYDNRPNLHNGQGQQTAVPCRDGFGPLCTSPQARSSTHGAYQL
ncbi:uncharacterized protein LOC111868157 [Cryptotermes secundus]|uniref:uncharacterized protein LOC111868157 n=1 Tax=Cryptotermes secundus TaxID=105785 RepID=UPI000CD7DBDF|nr:uncharacterized protein LOC111868157 [Cryptotermes secundus]